MVAIVNVHLILEVLKKGDEIVLKAVQIRQGIISVKSVGEIA
jgi:hypothetical protein